MNETILVPFQGDGGGVDTLSWGQCEIWRPMMAVGSSFPLGATYPAPPGTTVASIADMLRFVVSRHQSLRTRIVTDTDGTPRQHLDPWMQIEDYRNAISFATKQPDLDPARVGIWGISYSGGHVLILGAVDRRVRAVSSIVPVIDGYESMRLSHGTLGLRRLLAAVGHA